MKQIIFILLAFSSTLAMGQATQTGYQLDSLKSATFNLPVDTATTTAAHYMVSKKITGFYKVLEVVATITEISGTTGGTVTIEMSNDGVNWYSYYTSMDSTYSFTLADVATAQSYRWKIFDWGDAYIRVKAVGTGSPNFKIAATVMARKEI